MVINVDAGGVSGPSILAATGPEAGWLIREIAGVLPDPIGSSAIEALGSPATDYSLELRELGFIGFDFNLSWKKRIHSPLDNVDNIHPASIQHQGEHMLAVARHFGNISLDFPREPRPVYFDILGLTMVYYPTSWGLGILIGVTLVFAGVLFLGFRQKQLTLKGMALGAVTLSLSLVTAPLLLGLIQLVFFNQPALTQIPSVEVTPVAGLPVVTPSAGTGEVRVEKLKNDLVGDSPLSNVIRWGSAALALVATSLWYLLFQKIRWLEWDDLVMGAYLLLYLATFGTSVFVPALSYILVWPLLVWPDCGALLLPCKSQNGA